MRKHQIFNENKQVKNEGALVTSKKNSMQNHMLSTEIKF